MDEVRWPGSWTPAPLAPRQTTAEFVKATLRQAIFGGQLAGGTRLVQADLAAALEVSTTPVREALRELASEGLVRFDPHRGAVVYEPDTEDLEEIARICHALEPIAIRRAVERADGDLVERLRDLHGRMLTERNPAKWVDLNRTFHLSVYDASESPRMASIIQNLRDASVMYIGSALSRNAALADEANTDHAAIIDAIASRDPDAAVEATLRHLTLSVRTMTEAGTRTVTL
jgi:DNA-binding GntR family transcriptional regulator